MEAVGKSVTGMHRKNNEDAIYMTTDIDKLDALCIVADGMGGHNAGEVASSGAIEAFLSYIRENGGQYSESDILDMLVAGVQHGNSVIFEKASSDEMYKGMGTTFIVAAVLGKKLYITHVGDSRLYIFRDHVLSQMTKDHSFVMEMVKSGRMTLEEANAHPNKNVITRALGADSSIAIDTFIEDLSEDDLIMICSDGLSNMLEEDEITEILDGVFSLEDKVLKLVSLANDKGGKDNISVVLMK